MGTKEPTYTVPSTLEPRCFDGEQTCHEFHRLDRIAQQAEHWWCHFQKGDNPLPTNCSGLYARKKHDQDFDESWRLAEQYPEQNLRGVVGCAQLQASHVHLILFLECLSGQLSWYMLACFGSSSSHVGVCVSINPRPTTRGHYHCEQIRVPASLNSAIFFVSLVSSLCSLPSHTTLHAYGPFFCEKEEILTRLIHPVDLVMHVPFWKECTPDIQKQLMLRLDVRVYLPNDFIMSEGEVDGEFYMVNRGYCELNRPFNRFKRVTTTTMASAQSGQGQYRSWSWWFDRPASPNNNG
ncbi:unnamed protein product [Phytophthora lilii]|uniref:Unnamed protein product n=1 Tax=Phytophthora lilii TaxID=2077276 RepID=A0A9W6WJS9_9STRA|nr:unnamed protein product [Phytophthora lilii]